MSRGETPRTPAAGLVGRQRETPWGQSSRKPGSGKPPRREAVRGLRLSSKEGPPVERENGTYYLQRERKDGRAGREKKERGG